MFVLFFIFCMSLQKQTKLPDVIPNTIMFTPDGWYTENSTGTDLQQKVDEIFNLQENNEFGEDRYALLFTPGTYPGLHITVGYYTSVIGVGLTPDNVTFDKGNIEVKNKECPNPGALDNFWRSVENIHIIPSDDNMFWRVSQASPVRQMHVEGNLFFAQSPGWSSGGFMADSLISNLCLGQTQQQWFNRNAKFSQFEEIAWNGVCSGCVGVTGGNKDCADNKVLFTDIEKVPLIAPKPYLFLDNNMKYYVNVPYVKKDVSGVVVWGNGDILDISSFFVATPDNTADEINKNLEKGYHLLLTPGVYKLSDEIRIKKSGTVVLGLGYATLEPTNGNAAIVVENDAYGVRLASFMVQAGDVQSDALIMVGESKVKGKNLYSEDNPTILSDVFCRVGGQRNTQSSKVMLEINQDWVVTDNVWLWRADHDQAGKRGGLGPKNAVCNNALVVNGDNVYCYGLMTEHTLEELILWNGNNGKIHFLQSEMAYDVSDDWDHPCLKLGDNVKKFEGIAMGIYTFFAKEWNVNGPKVSSAVSVPENQPGIVIKSAMSLLLNADDGNGAIEHVINDIGNISDVSDADLPQWASWNTDTCPHHN